MNPIVFAMRHPITMMMLVVGLVAGGGLALNRMRVDIFPPLNTPKVYVFLQFGGMSPSQMEGLIVNQFELLFQYVDSVKEIKSRSIQQVALLEISFFPGTDMGQALAQVVAMGNRAMARMPPGTLPPMVIRMDGGTIAAGYLVLESEETPLGILGDLAQNIIRPLVQKYVPGTVAVSPFGPNARTILINIDPDKLRAYNLSPQDVVNALMTGNVVIPAGNLYIKDQMPLVPTNSLVANIQELGGIPLKLGSNVYIRDVGTVEDSTDVNYGYALVNGKKSVYLPIMKKDTASTLTVVADIQKAMPEFKNVLPRDVRIAFEFDASPTVKTAIRSVATEGLIGATLTGLMILIFLGDPRSVVVVVSNIPLALLGSLFGLYITGNTLNIMTLGGMALAIGILVDESTVTIENIHAQMEQHGYPLARAVLEANNATAVPRLLALMCILSVFIPAFIMQDPLRSLFMPLTLAVGFAMVSSYFLSSMYVPVIATWLLKTHPHGHAHAHDAPKSKGLFDRFQGVYERVVRGLVAMRWIVVPAYFAACLGTIALIGPRLGQELFPQVDSGEFVLRFRPPLGSNFEITRQMGVKCLEVLTREAKAENVEISMGYVGQVAPNYGMNNLVLFMRGPDDGWMRVALKEGSGIKLDEFRERLRKKLPEEVVPFLARLLEREGVSPELASERAAQSTFGFEPGDIVSTVMSFGSPTPIEVRVISPSLPDARLHASRILHEMKKIPFLRDVQYQQTLDYPTVEVNIDREKAGLSGVSVQQVGNGVIVATSSSRFIALNYWQDARTGFDYQVEVLVPTQRMTSSSQVETLPIDQVNRDVNLMVRDVAMVRQGSMPGQYDRVASQRFISVTANIEGSDTGSAARAVAAAIATANEKATGKPDSTPHGVKVETYGQSAPMVEMFESLAVGLGIAVFAILILLTAYFQSPRLAVISVSAVPGVVAGVAVALYSTHTTLNIESFMGSIMCIGVSVSNSVMLVTFMNDRWNEGKPTREAAVAGAAERLRPIIMTAAAMSIGMLPMALALEQGSEMQAPLGRAVIGGLVMSTFATLLILPAVFTLFLGGHAPKSPSIYPYDPESAHYQGPAATH